MGDFLALHPHRRYDGLDDLGDVNANECAHSHNHACSRPLLRGDSRHAHVYVTSRSRPRYQSGQNRLSHLAFLALLHRLHGILNHGLVVLRPTAVLHRLPDPHVTLE